MTLVDDLFAWGAANSPAGGVAAAASATMYGVSASSGMPEGSGQAELSYYPATSHRVGFGFPMRIPPYFQGMLTWTDAEGKSAELDLTIAAPALTVISGARADYEVIVLYPGQNDRLLAQFVPVDGGDDGTVQAPSGKISGNGSINPAEQPPLEAGVLSLVLEAIVGQ